MNCQVSQDVIFNMGAFNINISVHFKWETILSFAIHWNSSLSLPQACLPIWQIKVLHKHSIIRLTKLSFSFIWNADGVTKFSFVFLFRFFFFFIVIIFQLKPWIGLSLDSHQLYGIKASHQYSFTTCKLIAVTDNNYMYFSHCTFHCDIYSLLSCTNSVISHTSVA